MPLPRRRSARVVEWDWLEISCRGNSTGGSNPSFSAILLKISYLQNYPDFQCCPLDPDLSWNSWFLRQCTGIAADAISTDLVLECVSALLAAPSFNAGVIKRSQMSISRRSCYLLYSPETDMWEWVLALLLFRLFRNWLYHGWRVLLVSFNAFGWMCRNP